MAQDDETARLRTQVEDLEERLAEAERLRSAFMQNVAHELSNPLTPLVGYLKILGSDKMGALTPQQRKVLDSMGAAVSRLARVVENLSDFASLRAGRAAVLATSVDPDVLVAEVVDDQRAAIKEAHLLVQVVPSRGGPLQADARKLRQAVSNLVANAVKFSQHGGEVLVELTRAGGTLRVAVFDQGPGIPAEEQAHVFEPFFHATRAARAGEARRPGSGLGLPVARRIAEAHGGRVLLESPPRTLPRSGAHPFTGTLVILDLPAPPPAG